MTVRTLRRGETSRRFTPKQISPLAWYDTHLAGAAATTLADQMGGTAATLGSAAGADTNDPLWLPRSGVGDDYVYLPGTASNYISTPDSAALSLSGDIEMVVRLQLPDWTAGGVNRLLMGKWNDNGVSQRSYFLRLNTASSGVLQWFVSADGSASSSGVSTVAISTVFTANTTGWIKVTWVKSTGLTQFFYAADQVTEPSSWTQLGANVTIGAGITPFDSTAPLELGTRGNGASDPTIGRFYRAILRSGVAGSVVADFDASRFTSHTSYVDPVGSNAGTWTIGHSTSGRKATVVRTYGLLLHGVDDLVQVPAAAIPAFSTATAGTVVVAARPWGTALNNGRWFDARGSATETVAGVGIRQNGTADGLVATIGDGTSTAATAAVSYTAGRQVVASLLVDTTTISLRVNGATSATVARPAGSATAAGAGVFGAATTAAASPAEFAARCVLLSFNRLLTPSELGRIEDYFAAGS